MALTDTPHIATPRSTSLIWPRLQGWMARYIRAAARTDQIARLEAMSDAELAALGLQRDRIVMHVFRDRLWV